MQRLLFTPKAYVPVNFAYLHILRRKPSLRVRCNSSDHPNSTFSFIPAVSLVTGVHSTCNSVTVDLIDKGETYTDGTVDAWIYLTAEAPAIEDLPNLPHEVFPYIGDTSNVAFRVFFDGLRPCQHITVITVIRNKDSSVTETKVSRVSTECPCKDGTGKGDPHYTTFDRVHFNFNGNCTYLLAEDCVNKTKTFQIFARHGFPSGISSRRVVQVIAAVNEDGKRHVVSIKHNGVCRIDGRIVKFSDQSSYPSSVTYKRSDSGIHYVWPVRSDWWLEYNPAKFRVEVGFHASSSLRGKVCGLLGNNNGDKSDDLKKRDGSMAANFDELGDHFAVPGSCPDQ
ncbi:BMP-binding endothelial regulator protein-like [Ptychodera flava]|uniref:BMP-binding endothelial regulator protein-like n=1 Tax=Ptychodera flava TaxID=63121 RepID=UPI003969CBE4